MINWKIESVAVKPQDGLHSDVVVTAAWRCTAVDGEHSASNHGSKSFRSPLDGTINYGSNFIPYSSLTEADVLNWVWANGVNKDAIEANVTRELADKVSPPTVVKPLPWVS